LFEEISEQPEYYPTPAESEILERNSDAIREMTGPLTLIELGSGTSAKTQLLLAAYGRGGETVQYLPVDVSESALRAAAEQINHRHPTVHFLGLVGRYEAAFPLFKQRSPAMVLFLGSTIGNFTEAEEGQFWSAVASNLNEGDFVLLGVDLVKDRHVLEAAYNDRAGVTAQFTTNIFARMNRELGTTIDLGCLEHVAVYNDKLQRVEISVRFREDQDVTIAPLDRTLPIRAGQSVAIEISRKYVVADLKKRAAGFGFEVQRVFTDSEDRFAVMLMRRR
jgi:L-histidine N-alpha-methyltransferase